MGGLMLLLWVIRFCVFHLYESPKYLMGKGKDEQAVEVVHKVAKYNRTTCSLSAADLKRVDNEENNTSENVPDHAKDVFRRHLSRFDGNHIKPLFATRRIATSTTLLIILWGKFIPSQSKSERSSIPL